jgi:hypothetical protein
MEKTNGCTESPGFNSAVIAGAIQSGPGQSGAEFLSRHQNRDWGEVNTEDARANDESIASDGRLLSAYLLKDHTRLWVITESDRSSTCLLLPEEY